MLSTGGACPQGEVLVLGRLGPGGLSSLELGRGAAVVGLRVHAPPRSCPRGLSVRRLALGFADQRVEPSDPNKATVLALLKSSEGGLKNAAIEERRVSHVARMQT